MLNKVDRIIKKIRVYGTVQGVGFRPFVYNLAIKYNLFGYVNNDNIGVNIEVSGEATNISSFLEDLKNNPPPLAVIEEIKIENERAFMYKVARNLTFNESKKFKNKEFVEYEDDRFFCSKEEQPDEILLETKKDELLLEALETLPKHLREVFILHFFDGYDKKQIASMLNLNLNTVQKYVINATTHLTKYIEDRDWN